MGLLPCPRVLSAIAWLISWLTIAEDGLSYIEIGEAYFRGDWKHAINGYWSPAYSWVLGFALSLVHPSRTMESTVIHIANFVIYVFSIIAFDYFLDKQKLSGREVREIIERTKQSVTVAKAQHEPATA